MPLTSDADISRLLAAGQITAITVDTNIFDEKALRFNSPVLQAVSRLKDRRFGFILPSTVTREVRRHLEQAMENALREAKKQIGTALHLFETEKPTRNELLASISGGASPAEAADKQLKTYIEATGCEVLDDTALVDAATIYDAYFADEPPFGSSAKKSEFPDALALNALERIAKDRQIGVIVVSKDKDWRAYCEGSQRLHLVPDIERALALISNAPVELRWALRNWLADGHPGRVELSSRLESEVERIDFGANGNPTSGELEAIGWGGRLIGIEWPEDDDIDIIEVSSAGDGENRVVLSLPLHLKVKVEVELNFSVWDSIDKESIGMGGRTIEVDETLTERATLILDVHNPGAEDEDIDLDNVELDSYSHEVELGDVDVFEPEDAWADD